MAQPAANVPTPSRLARFLRRLPVLTTWAYLVLLLALWYVLGEAEGWWLATVLMFAPRWIFALPLALLVPVAVYRRSIRLCAVLVVCAGVALVPVAGFNIPWDRVTEPKPKGMPFRVVTLNMHYAKGHANEVERLIDSTWPDVIAIQEWSGARKIQLTPEKDWHVHSTAQLFFASRSPIRRVEDLDDRRIKWLAPAARYEVETPDGIVTIFSLHTESSRNGISGVFNDYRRGAEEVQGNSDLRRQQLEYIADRARNCEGAVIVVGDFNTPPESILFPEIWRGFTNAFGKAGWGFGYTFIGAKTTVRIDHVLTNRKWGVADCRVGPNVGSPHRPVIADLVRLEK